MYSVNIEIEGIAPLIQNRFGPETQVESGSPAKKASGTQDWSLEWKDKVYADEDGNIFQPAAHIEGSLVKAAVNFKIKGRRGRSYKDLVKAACWVEPEMIPHHIKIPEKPDHDPRKPFSLDSRPVVVSRARVMRTRPMLAKGWKLAFTISVIDDQLMPEVLKDILDEAGRIGIGDYRPRFGRFIVTSFQTGDSSD